MPKQKLTKKKRLSNGRLRQKGVCCGFITHFFLVRTHLVFTHLTVVLHHAQLFCTFSVYCTSGNLPFVKLCIIKNMLCIYPTVKRYNHDTSKRKKRKWKGAQVLLFSEMLLSPLLLKTKIHQKMSHLCLFHSWKVSTKLWTASSTARHFVIGLNLMKWWSRQLFLPANLL